MALVDQAPESQEPGLKGNIMAPKNGLKPQSLRKAEFLEHWASLAPDQEIQPTPVPYKHSGSTYAEFGIRITGSRDEIDQVISNLKQLLQFEHDTTRLQVVYKQSQDRDLGIPIDSWNCYIQIHKRGGQAAAVNQFMSAVTGREKSV